MSATQSVALVGVVGLQVASCWALALWPCSAGLLHHPPGGAAVPRTGIARQPAIRSAAWPSSLPSAQLPWPPPARVPHHTLGLPIHHCPAAPSHPVAQRPHHPATAPTHPDRSPPPTQPPHPPPSRHPPPGHPAPAPQPQPTGSRRRQAHQGARDAGAAMPRKQAPPWTAHPPLPPRGPGPRQRIGSADHTSSTHL